MAPSDDERAGSASNARRAAPWLVASLAFAIAAYGLRIAVEPPDHGYTRYAVIAFEMVCSGDWIAPRLDHHLYVDKPPLSIWLIALPMVLADSTANATQHAPNLVAAALSVLFLRRLGGRVFGRGRAGWLAAGMYLSALLPFAMLRDKRIDPLFAALLLGAFDCLHAALAEREPSRRRLAHWLGAGALVAAATLTKGPLALAFFLAVAIAYAAWTQRLRALASRDALAAAALWLVLVAPWPLAMLHDVGWAAWRDRLAERHLVTRFAGPLHYLKNLPERIAPWTLLLPALLPALATALRGAAGPALRFPVAWFAVVFALLHVTAAKHSRYMLPALPALSLMSVAPWIDAASGRAAALGRRVGWLRDAAVALLLGLGVLAGIALPFVPIWRPAARVLWPGFAIGGALTGFVAIAGLRRLRDPLGALGRAVVVVLLAEAGFDGLRAADFLARSQFERARVALADVAAGAPTLLLGVDGEGRNAVVLATRRRVTTGGDRADALRFARAHPDGLIVTGPQTLAGLRGDPALALGEAVPLRLADESLVLVRLGPTPPP